MESSKQKPTLASEDLARRLRHFGLDYLTLNIGLLWPNDPIPPSLRFLDILFDLPHNETNAADYKNFMWGEGSEEVNLLFSTYGNDPVIHVSRGEDNIMMIRKISPSSNMPRPVKEKYKYQVQFYGWFFGLVRLRCFTVEDYWHLFLSDIRNGVVRLSISRIDICADIEHASVSSIERSIVRKGRMQARSKLEIDEKTGIPGTVVLGARSQNSKTRIYNKLEEIRAKRKESLYPDYIGSSCITRLEIELHSRPCQEYAVTLEKCLDLEFILGVYMRFLDKRSGRWRILNFITQELKKSGLKAIPAERIKIDHKELPKRAFFMQGVNKVKECARRYGMTHAEVLREMMPLLGVGLNSLNFVPEPSSDTLISL